MEEKDLMIDLETMSVEPDAAIIQIGALWFDRDSDWIDKGFRGNIALQSSLMAGLRTDPQTIEWWAAQPARIQGMVSFGAQELWMVLSQLRAYMDQHRVRNIWCKGASFDFPVLRHSIRACRAALGQHAPRWDFWLERDSRTILATARELCGWKPSRGLGATHDALEDCHVQVHDLKDALRCLSPRSSQTTLPPSSWTPTLGSSTSPSLAERERVCVPRAK